MKNIINKIKIFTFVFFVSSLLNGCGGEGVHHYKKENIVSVFYHENNRYSVMVSENNELKSVSFIKGLKVKILTDAKDGESMWYEMEYNYSSYNGLVKDKKHFLNIHIHNHKDLSGASWNKGKFGTGKTVKVSE
jgi:hypothetical protein